MCKEREILFKKTFSLRKAVPELANMLAIFQALLVSGYKLHTGFDATNIRWLQLSVYEASISHPTLSMCRQLKDSPSPETKVALSIINFSSAHRAGFEFDVSDDATSFEIRILAPTKNSDKLAIQNNIKLLQ